MKGSIRMILGFLIVFGAVGHMDYDPNSSIFIQTMIALVGLAITANGVRAMERQQGEFREF